ncbi:MAG: plasmid stability protein StbB [Methylococcales bacterium]|nr:plasmid stability protein StbB [Methylococcales bacterium]
MRITVMNYTGTVGKTTVATHLLSPRMCGAPIIAVESINETAAGMGASVVQMKGDKFKELFQRMVTTDDLIVDVGASNIEDFLEGMSKVDDSHAEFDFFIVPVTNGTKEQRETISMINTLAALGVPAEKIRLLFNRVKSSVEEEYQILLNYVGKSNNATANTEAAIYENELFDLLAVKKLSIEKLLNDPKDYKVLLREKKDADPKQRAVWAEMFTLKLLAKGVNRNLDSAYAALFM